MPTLILNARITPIISAHIIIKCASGMTRASFVAVKDGDKVIRSDTGEEITDQDLLERLNNTWEILCKANQSSK